MRRYWSYFWYVMRHKWFVFLACMRLGVPLWRAVVHDWTKFTHVEFGPYARTFFNADGTRANLRRPDGGYDPNNTGGVTEFSYAWINHQRNKHHWQAWISIGDGGRLKAVMMLPTYVDEMVADWIGAGQAISGERNPKGWYEKNKDLMILHPATRVMVEDVLSKLA